MQETTSSLLPTTEPNENAALQIEVPKVPSVLILASASPRRSELVSTLGIPFVVAPSDVAEPRPTRDEESHPAAFVERLARFKAENCNAEAVLGADHKYSRVVVLAADTVVWHEGAILNKPESEDEARTMLRRLRGKSHTVYTGVCLRLGEHYCVSHESTMVQFGQVSDWWIDAYVATGEPMDKAGAYAAQGKGALLVERIAGDFWNVVGLPLWRLGRMFEQIGMPVEDWWEKQEKRKVARPRLA